MSLSSSKSTYATQLFNTIKNLQSQNQNDADTQLQDFCNAFFDKINAWLQSSKKAVAVNPETHIETGTQSGLEF